MKLAMNTEYKRLKQFLAHYEKASLIAILSDKRFDFSKAYIIVSGCDGATPDKANLEDVIIATSSGAFSIGMSNGFSVASTIIDSLI
jgi:hypothetical protein